MDTLNERFNKIRIAISKTTVKCSCCPSDTTHYTIQFYDRDNKILLPIPGAKDGKCYAQPNDTKHACSKEHVLEAVKIMLELT